MGHNWIGLPRRSHRASPRRRGAPWFSLTSVNRGLSLIELTVTVAIVSILVGMAAPSILHQRSEANDAAARSNVASTARSALGYYAQGSFPVLPSTEESLQSFMGKIEPAFDYTIGPSETPRQLSVARHSDTLMILAARSKSGRCIVAFADLSGPSFISAHNDTPCDAESFESVYGYIPIQHSAFPEVENEEAPPTTTTTLPPPTTTTTAPTTTTTEPPTTTTTTAPTTTTTLPPPTTTTTLPPATPATSPPSSGAFYEGYNLMTIGSASCGLEIDLNNFSIEGGLHANGWVSIDANNGSVAGPATASSNVDLRNTSFDGDFAYSPPIEAPILWHPSEWAPGSARAAALDKQWHYWPSGMTITKKNQEIEKGVHYVNGDVLIELGTKLKIQGTTIIATGKINIDVNGPVELSHHTGEDLTLFAWSYGYQSCNAAGIDLNANSAKLEGLFYAPHDKIKLTAHANSNFTGNVVGAAVEVGGNVLRMFNP